MEYDKQPPKFQLVKTIEPVRELSFHLSRLTGYVFDAERIYRDGKTRRVLNDAIFYAVCHHLLRGKRYPTMFEPANEFYVCCLFILNINGFDENNELLDDGALEELLEVIQEYFSYLDRGDSYDLWEVKPANRTIINIKYKGDYRIELFHFLELDVNNLEERMMVEIDDSHTLFKEFSRRDRAALEEKNRSRGESNLSF